MNYMLQSNTNKSKYNTPIMDKIMETASENMSETSDFINKKCNKNIFNKTVG